MIIELDVDGVIADMYTPLNKLVSDKFGIEFNANKDIQSWDMDELPKSIKSYILQTFQNPKYIASLKPYEYALYSVQELSKIFPDTMIHFNTTMLSEENIGIRKQWLLDFIEQCGIDNARIHVDNKLPKTMLSYSDIVMEDNVDHILSSPAHTKFLVRRCHNRDFIKNELPLLNNKIIVVDDILDVVLKLQK